MSIGVVSEPIPLLTKLHSKAPRLGGRSPSALNRDAKVVSFNPSNSAGAGHPAFGRLQRCPDVIRCHLSYLSVGPRVSYIGCQGPGYCRGTVQRREFDVQSAAGRSDDRPLDDELELAHVSWPVVLLKSLHGCKGQQRLRPADLWYENSWRWPSPRPTAVNTVSAPTR